MVLGGALWSDNVLGASWWDPPTCEKRPQGHVKTWQHPPGEASRAVQAEQAEAVVPALPRAHLGCQNGLGPWEPLEGAEPGALLSSWQGLATSLWTECSRPNLLE